MAPTPFRSRDWSHRVTYRKPEPDVVEAILPEECLGMPPELAFVDSLYDDAVFFEPYRTHFHAWLGRPSVPSEVFLT